MNENANASYTDAKKQENNSGYGDPEETMDFSKNVKLLNQERIGEGPFNVVTTDEGSFIAIGAERLTKKLTHEEAWNKVEDLKKIDWQLIMSAISVITKQTVMLHHLEIMAWEKKERDSADMQHGTNLKNG